MATSTNLSGPEALRTFMHICMMPARAIVINQIDYVGTLEPLSGGNNIRWCDFSARSLPISMEETSTYLVLF